MWFWWFMLVCDLLVPITMILCGRMMWKHAPEKINGVMGNRMEYADSIRHNTFPGLWQVG